MKFWSLTSELVDNTLFLSLFSLTEIKEIPGQTSQRLPLNKEKSSPNVCIFISMY